MLPTITTSAVTPEQLEQIERFLAAFLPRLKREPGVVEILHFVKREQGEETTPIVWEGPDALARYREGKLIREAMAVERQLGLQTTRDRAELTLRLV